MRNTIAININGRKDEAYASQGTIVPGTLLERRPHGEVQNHSVAAGTAAVLIAVEDSYRGKTIEDPYYLRDTVHLYHCLPGDLFYGWIVDLTVAPLDYVISAGDGQFAKATTPPYTDRAIVGLVLEVDPQLVEPMRNRAVIEVI